MLQDFLYMATRQSPNKEAIIIPGKNRRAYTYAEVLSSSMATASWLLAKGMPAGFRGALLTDDPFDYITSYFGIMIAGGIVVGLNTQTSERTLKTVLNNCTASVIFAHAKYLKYLENVLGQTPSVISAVISNLGACTLKTTCFVKWNDHQEIMEYRGKFNAEVSASSGPNQEDIAQIIYTSGTTGEPKGVMLRHSNLTANTSSIIKYLGLTANDRIMAVLPFFYSYGNSVMLTHIAAGGSLVVNQNFTYPNVILDQMLEERVTGFSGVPSTFAILLNRSTIRNYHFPSLRYITQAGAAMSPVQARKLKKIFPEVDLFIMYGQTEASARLAYLNPANFEKKSGSIGKAIPGVTLKLLDSAGQPVSTGETGEIVAQGDNIMAGYWEKPDETARVVRQEGLWTGDLATQDKEGYLYIISRRSDIIKSGSHRIGPKEIEDVILEHEATHEVAVIGVEDEILGEVIKACVILKPGVICSDKDIIKHCRKNLQMFKVPVTVDFFDEFPITATGKIRKTVLKLSIEKITFPEGCKTKKGKCSA